MYTFSSLSSRRVDSAARDFNHRNGRFRKLEFPSDPLLLFRACKTLSRVNKLRPFLRDISQIFLSILYFSRGKSEKEKSVVASRNRKILFFVTRC